MNNNNITINQGNQFEIFNYQNLGQVRIQVDQYGNPWFCLVDVCKILNLQPNKVLERLNPYGRNLIPVIDNMGRTQQATFVDQGNLFMTIGRSRKPEAKVFMDWVYREVLPSIANKGYYNMPQMTEMQMIHSISGELIEQKKILDEYGNTINQHTQQINEHTRMIEILEREGYYIISGYAKLKGVPITLNDARNLGSMATEICIQRNISVAPVQHDRLNYVHAYPFGILNEVFSNTILGN